jgi:hypothetical protein
VWGGKNSKEKQGSPACSLSMILINADYQVGGQEEGQGAPEFDQMG